MMIWEWVAFILGFIIPVIGISIFIYRIKTGKSKKPEPGRTMAEGISNWF